MDHQNKEPAEPPRRVELTPKLLSAIQDAAQARRERKETQFPELVANCPYVTYVAVAAFVFEQIVAHARDGGTFQQLIYERLGCGVDAYAPLFFAGGMVISNEFVLSAAPDEEEELRLSRVLDEVIREQPMGETRAALIDLMFRLAELSSFARIAKSIIERQRSELDALVKGGK